MKTGTWLRPAALAGLGFLAWAAVAAGEKIWVSTDGKEHVVHARAAAMVLDDEGATEFDLADLRDGETRVIGEGTKQLTARREGDVVTIERPASGDDPELRMTCRLASDSCKVLTFESDPQKVMLMIQKERICVNGEGDCGPDVDLDIAGEGGSEVIVHRVLCHGDDCQVDGGAGEGVTIVRTAPNGAVAREPHGKIMVLRDSKLVRRCPEGDTTMRIDPSEKETTFRCPKHGLELK